MVVVVPVLVLIVVVVIHRRRTLLIEYAVVHDFAEGYSSAGEGELSLYVFIIHQRSA